MFITIAAILLACSVFAVVIIMWKSIKSSFLVPCNYDNPDVPSCEECKEQSCELKWKVINEKQ